MSKQFKFTISLIFLITPIILLAFLLFNNYQYNKTPRHGSIVESVYNGSVYDLGDISVELAVRSGDSGAWLKDPIYDDDGQMLHGASVGTIYEVVIHNQTKNTVSDWKIKIPINEFMWVNNNWNSKMEIHQNVMQEEKVLAIDLSDYSDYDINLDYYIDHTGPMIPLYEGDYFIYLPEEIAEEKPIPPAKTGEKGEALARFGYIMYIPDQTIDYVADFSGGEIEYYMYENPLAQKWFWILIGFILVCIVGIIVQIAVDININKLVKQQQEQKAHDEEMVNQTMQLVINLIESKDINTKGHSIRVAEISSEIAKKMGFTEEESKDVYYIGLMHDCGKINIPSVILKNPGRLSDDEFAEMKKHTLFGADALKDFTSIKDIGVGAKYHHERYDGRGYPSGLKGEEIPLVARIIGVADSFDAMNSNRCYRDRLSREVIIDELVKNKEKQFDPNVVDAMLELIESGIVEIGK